MRRWWAAGLLLAGLLASGALALRAWLGSADLRASVEAEASAALGVRVTAQRLHTSFWPLPGAAVDGLVVHTQPPLSAQTVQARPALDALLRGRLELATLTVEGAQLPQAGVDRLLAALQKKERDGKKTRGSEPDSTMRPGILPRRVIVRALTWTPAGGAPMTLDASVRLDDDLLPAQADLRLLRGRLSGAQATLVREAPGRWQLRADVGGGRITGPLTLTSAAAQRGPWTLGGELQTAGVEVAALTAPARPLSGRLDARTQLQARAATPGALAEALQTQTQFTVRGATVHGLDLARAVKTLGTSRGGETRLDQLDGEVRTQGKAVRVERLVARSGVLAARGQVAVSASRALSGQVSVDLAGGVVGVPLVLGGTVDAPEVTLTRGALVGGALGTAVLPGVGTGAGAKLGDRLGRMLGGR